MAIAFRIKSVDYTVDTVGMDGSGDTVDLSESGQVLVHAEYIDTASPQTVIVDKRFILPSSLTVDDIQAQINGYGVSVRNARVRTGELQQFVGAVVPLVDAPVAEPEV